MIIWLTGLPCSGKTTVANALAVRLSGGLGAMIAGSVCEVLDGDHLRGSNFGAGAGFDPEQRRDHLLRAGYMAHRLANHVPYVICSFVSPVGAVRQELPVDLMVYVDCPPDVCRQRDTKGMWAKAERGEIVGFTGHDAPYESPTSPDVTVHTDTMSVAECVDAIIRAVKEKG